MAKFGPKVWSGNGIEIYVSAHKPKKKGTPRFWFRIQGEPGSQLRIYEALAYARSVDVCFEPDDRLKPRKARKSGP